MNIEINLLPPEIREQIRNLKDEKITFIDNGEVVFSTKPFRSAYDALMEYDGPDVSDIEIEFERDKVPSNRTLNLFDDE